MKETEGQNVSDMQDLSGQDQARKHRKTVKAAVSFLVMILLLVALFFAAVNIGSLKVGFPELVKGVFHIQESDAVATIVDLRFPRIFISILASTPVGSTIVAADVVLFLIFYILGKIRRGNI